MMPLMQRPPDAAELSILVAGPLAETAGELPIGLYGCTGAR